MLLLSSTAPDWCNMSCFIIKLYSYLLCKSAFHSAWGGFAGELQSVSAGPVGGGLSLEGLHVEAGAWINRL